MTFYGITTEKLQQIADRLDITLENVRSKGRGISAKLTPRNSDHRYARRGRNARRVKACSYEAFRDFILSAYASGATSVATIDPIQRKTVRMDSETFNSFLGWDGPFYNLNIGSQAEPERMGELSNATFSANVVAV